MERSWLLDTVNGDMLAEPKLHHGCGTSRACGEVFRPEMVKASEFMFDVILTLARNAVIIPSNVFLLAILR